MNEDFINRRVGRRRLLGKAGALAAAAAGTSAALAAASPASASSGNPLVIGQSNASTGADTTTITNNSPNAPAFVVGNTVTPEQVAEGTVTYQVAGPALQLAPSGDTIVGPVGSLGVSNDGTLWSVGKDVDGAAFTDIVRTGLNTPYVESFSPIRILNTWPDFPLEGKRAMLNPSVIDANGYIKAAQTLYVQLDDLFEWAWAIFANFTIVGGGQSGFARLWPAGAAMPTTSTLGWDPGKSTANFALVSCGSMTFNGKLYNNVISVWAQSPAKLLLDISGAVVNYASDVKAYTPAAQGTGQATPARQRPANTLPY
jgi:hypothetical protein